MTGEFPKLAEAIGIGDDRWSAIKDKSVFVPLIGPSAGLVAAL